MSSRYPALQGQRDANEASIIKALEAVGATVEQLPTGKGVPDLLVGYQPLGMLWDHPKNYLMEVKRQAVRGKIKPSDVILNKKQKEWHEAWKGQKCIVRTPEEALKVIGINHG